MKFFILIALFAFNALAVEIPLKSFDQSKLETILRRIPEAKAQSQLMGPFTRVFYQYPKSESPFQITCEADHYNSNPIPSFSRCKVKVSDKEDFRGDEYLFKVSDSTFVNQMSSAISYGAEVKKSYSLETVYGQAFTGEYRHLFRYLIICKKADCTVSFSSKPAL